MLKMFNKSRNLNGKPNLKRKLLGGSKLNHQILLLNPMYLADIIRSLDITLNGEARRINAEFGIEAWPSIVSIEDKGRMKVEDFIRAKYVFAEQFYGKNLVIETYTVSHNKGNNYNNLRKVDGAQLRVSELGDIVVFETLPLDNVAISFTSAIKDLLKYQIKS